MRDYAYLVDDLFGEDGKAFHRANEIIGEPLERYVMMAMGIVDGPQFGDPSCRRISVTDIRGRPLQVLAELQSGSAPVSWRSNELRGQAIAALPDLGLSVEVAEELKAWIRNTPYEDREQVGVEIGGAGAHPTFQYGRAVWDAPMPNSGMHSRCLELFLRNVRSGDPLVPFASADAKRLWAGVCAKRLVMAEPDDEDTVDYGACQSLITNHPYLTGGA